MKKAVDSALMTHFSLKANSAHSSVKDGVLTSYVHVVNLLFETYAPEERIIDTDKAIVRFNQPEICRDCKMGTPYVWISCVVYKCPIRMY